MSKKYLMCGLDVGTNSTKVLAGVKNFDTGEIEIIAQSSVPSTGVRKGVVISIDESARSIAQAVDEVQEIANQRIKNVFCGIGGSHIFVISGQGRVAVSRADEMVSEEDIKRAIAAAEAFSLPPNKQIIKSLPKDYVLDGEGGIKDVLGMKGIRLEAHTLLLGGFIPYIKNLTKSVLGADLEVSDLFLSPMASAQSVLTNRQKELGVALIDIGASTTSLAVFEEGSLIHLTVIPVGSSHITNDIAIGLKIDIDTAEKIKLEFATAIAQGTGKREIIDLSEDLGELLTFSKKELAEIVESRLSEIFDLINKELKSISKSQLLPAGAVLTGGGSKLPKLKDFAKKELKLPVQIGVIKGFAEPLEDPSLSVCAGLIMLSEENSGDGRKINFDSNGKAMNKFKKFLKIFVP